MFTNDAWLSGFIDGEGCFTHTGGSRSPKFKIGLHGDDREVLDSLQQEFGGHVYERRTGHVDWHVTRRSELAELVRYLTRFPLRAKKAAQFASWRLEFGL